MFLIAQINCENLRGLKDFPKKGIVVIGSEELGVSPEAVKKAQGRVITIPMYGIKASINVSVAFGICMQKWCEALTAD